MANLNTNSNHLSDSSGDDDANNNGPPNRKVTKPNSYYTYDRPQINIPDPNSSFFDIDDSPQTNIPDPHSSFFNIDLGGVNGSMMAEAYRSLNLQVPSAAQTAAFFAEIRAHAEIATPSSSSTDFTVQWPVMQRQMVDFDDPISTVTSVENQDALGPPTWAFPPAIPAASCNVSRDLSATSCNVSPDLSATSCNVSPDLSATNCNVSPDLSATNCNVSRDLSAASCNVSRDLPATNCNVSQDLSAGGSCNDSPDFSAGSRNDSLVKPAATSCNDSSLGQVVTTPPGSPGYMSASSNSSRSSSSASPSQPKKKARKNSSSDFSGSGEEIPDIPRAPIPAPLSLSLPKTAVARKETSSDSDSEGESTQAKFSRTSKQVQERYKRKAMEDKRNIPSTIQALPLSRRSGVASAAPVGRGEGAQIAIAGRGRGETDGRVDGRVHDDQPAPDLAPVEDLMVSDLSEGDEPLNPPRRIARGAEDIGLPLMEAMMPSHLIVKCVGLAISKR